MARLAEKKCGKCGQMLPLAEFHKSTKASDGHQSWCKACNREKTNEWRARNREHVNKYAADWRAQNKEAIAGYKRRLKYDITDDQFNDLRDAQAGKCAICARQMEFACVDHCHSTGEVRGLLCASCNIAIGHMKDDPGRLRAAAAYLESHI